MQKPLIWEEFARHVDFIRLFLRLFLRLYTYIRIYDSSPQPDGRVSGGRASPAPEATGPLLREPPLTSGEEVEGGFTCARLF